MKFTSTSILMILLLNCSFAQSDKSLFSDPSSPTRFEVFNAEDLDLGEFLNQYRIQTSEVGLISTIQSSDGNNFGLVGIGHGGAGISAGVVAIGTGNKQRNVGVISESFGDVANIGIVTRAHDGLQNVGIEAAASGKGKQINIGVVAKSVDYLDEPGLNFGIRSMAFGKGVEGGESANVGVEAEVGGDNNFNVGFRANILKKSVSEDRDVSSNNSRNFAFKGRVSGESSSNFGIYQECMGDGSSNLALYCKSSGGTSNIAAQLIGDVLFEDEKGHVGLKWDATNGNLISEGMFVNQLSVEKNLVREITGAGSKLSSLIGQEFFNEEEIVGYGLEVKTIQKEFPQAVVQNQEGNDAVNYSVLIPFIIEAMKEMEAKIDQQALLIEKLSTKKKVVEEIKEEKEETLPENAPEVKPAETPEVDPVEKVKEKKKGKRD